MVSEKRILVFGSSGQLAQSLRPLLPGAIFVPRTEADLASVEQVRRALDRHRPQLVINAAAYTQVDQAESEFELAWRVNALAPAEMGDWCAANEASLIHYSTDYVYTGKGTTPWVENDDIGPLNAYGKSKLGGEEALAKSGCHYFALRTSWLYSPFGKNFAKTMIRLGQTREGLKVVADQIGAPTSTLDLARATVQLLAHPDFRKHSGIYNIANAGETSWCGFAREIFAWLGEHQIPLKVNSVEPISTAEYPTPAVRPLNSRMNCSAFKRDFGIALRPWQEGLNECLGDYPELWESPQNEARA
jgi:dTDP-4-dehydrorhamnose reductase